LRRDAPLTNRIDVEHRTHIAFYGERFNQTFAADPMFRAIALFGMPVRGEVLPPRHDGQNTSAIHK
jgi:hypothetical protein